MSNLLQTHLLNSLLKHQEREAIFLRNRSFTYLELLENALAMRDELINLGVMKGDKIAIISPKTPSVLASMFGVLLAGCTYVPVDPKLPIIRQSYIVEDAGANVIFVPADYNKSLVEKTTVYFKNHTLITVDFDNRFDPQGNIEYTVNGLIKSLEASISEEDLAYILYTSGSTGVPKGVSISHKNAMNFIAWGRDYFQIANSDRVAVHSSLSFDLPVFDVYVGLLSGACLYPISEENVLFPQAILNFLNENEITVLYAVPSSLIALLTRSNLSENNLIHLKYLLFAGEEFPLKQFNELRKHVPKARFFNLYGPIETNVITAFEIEVDKPFDYQRIPLGYPISNTEIAIIDSEGADVVNTGTIGELIVTGPSVSPGYWQQRELTTKSRITKKHNGSEVFYYRTGDLVSYDDAGWLLYHGRVDNMVKTRGFRVELEEVESVINRHPGVLQAAVISQPDAQYTNLLYAFVVAQEGCQIDMDTIKTWAANYLPNYALPEKVIFLADLPKGNTGKVTRKQLNIDEHVA